jgi:hypothetical protein
MATTNDTEKTARWAIGGLFLEAFVDRDYARLRTTLADDLTMRAMLPRGAAEFSGADEVAETFRGWFGDATDFELEDAGVGEVGGRLHLSWRLRVRPAPFGKGDGWHVIEQHVYADAGDTISALDLLCSGFRPV